MNTLSTEFTTAYLHEIGIYTPLLLQESNTPTVTQCKPAIAPTLPPPIATTLPAPSPTIDPPLPPIKAIKSPIIPQGMALLDLQKKVSACTACNLSKSRKQTVFGNGNIQADLVFVGDAPDADDDREGMPFSGRSGALLNRMITAMGMTREQVYTMHTIKCRPPWNHDPTGEEVAACRGYFDAQLQALQPKFICLLGRVAAQQVLGNNEGLTSLREGVHDYQGVPVYVTYHPAYLLRNPARKQQTWQDLQRLMQRHIKA